MVKKSMLIENTRDLESPHNSPFAAFVLTIASQRIRADSTAVQILADGADRDVRAYLSSREEAPVGSKIGQQVIETVTADEHHTETAAHAFVDEVL